MNKLPALLFVFGFAMLLSPSLAHAYSFTQISSLGDGKHFSSASGPSYVAPDGSLYGIEYYYADPGNHRQLCESLASANTVPATEDLYCVYEANVTTSSFGSGFWGSGGGNPGGTTMTIYNGKTKLYRTPLQQSISASPVPNDVCLNGGESCDVFHNEGAVQTLPTATLTATPATVVEGNSSALTYSCSNSSTAAVIDNGVGAVSPVSAGTVSVTPTTSTTYTLTCTNAAGTDTATAAVTVTPPPTFPDLTASSVTPASATAATPVTLSSTITNGGAASTGIGFTNLFQRASDSSGSNATDIGTHTNGVLGSGSSNTIAQSYTFPSAGTYYVRSCADKSSAGNTGVVSESDEANNCGPWTTITVSAVPSPTPTCTLSASPTASVPSTLTWSATNATSCTGGGFSTGGATSGTATVNTAGAYTLSCTGTGGSCPTQSISVGAGACTAATGTITASPNRIKAGQSATLSYSATGITGSCTVLGPGVSTTLPAASCTVPAGTLSTGALSTQSLYILTCDGVERARTVVNVVPTIIEF